MAVGDVVGGLESIADEGVLALQPPGSDEWVIHNIYFNDAVQLEIFDGVNTLTFDNQAGPGVLTNLQFHCTNARHVRVKNTSGGEHVIAYDGVQTK